MLSWNNLAALQQKNFIFYSKTNYMNSNKNFQKYQSLPTEQNQKTY